MNCKNSLATLIIFQSILCWLSLATFADVWFNRATYWKAKGNLERAEADFTRAIELKPHLADAYAQRGLVRLRQSRAGEAQPDFDRCLALNQDLRQSLERLIAETKQQMAGRNPRR